MTFIFIFIKFSAWDCSVQMRTYGLFLEERLECFRVFKYDIEAEKIPTLAQGQENKVFFYITLINFKKMIITYLVK